jgi:two-component system cell cycle response regulator
MTSRILVIEDNLANMELMTYLLQAFGHATLKAWDGKEGVEIAARERPDLIICDIQLPLINGYEVARQIKAEPALRHIPLLAVTAFAMADDRQKTLAAGFDAYFSKPISPDTFVQRVQDFLRPEQRTSGASASSAFVRPSAPARSRGRTVLVVDDRKDNRDLALSILEGSGYQVITTHAMSEGLLRAHEAVPDLILSDVCMADGSGYEFIQRVKADPQLAAIPFVFLTSTMTSETERKKGLALGAARFLFRPIEPQDLLREIEACLREREGR